MGVMSLVMITVTGMLLEAVGGDPLAGTVRFRSEGVSELTDPAGNVVYGEVDLTVTLDAQGAFSVSIPATNAPLISPAGWVYRLDINALPVGSTQGGIRRTMYVQLPYDTPGGTVDLADLTEVQEATPTYVSYATTSQLLAETAARQAADTTLTNDLAAEVTARISADDTLQTNITNEASARASADNSLQDQITTVAGYLEDLLNRVLAIENGTATLTALNVSGAAFIGGDMEVVGPAITGGKNFFLPMQPSGRFTYAGPPLTGDWEVGDQTVDANGALWLCTAAGTPGTWVSA